MGFKLGKARQPEMTYGNLRSKLKFGGEAGGDASVPGSHEDKQVINHEMRHATDMRLGKLAYSDDDITYNGEVFPRETINCKDMIKVDGKWKEAGDHGFPWEDDANNGSETSV